MKIRNGFVSNSSSSSFIIAYKGELNEELKKAFKLPDSYPFKEFNITEVILNAIEITFLNQNDITQYILDNNYEPYPIKDIQKYIDLDYKVCTGSFSSDEVGIESLLSNVEIDLESESFVMKSWGY